MRLSSRFLPVASGALVLLSACTSAPPPADPAPSPVRALPPAADSTPATSNDGLSTAFHAAFAAADLRARAIAYYQMCAATVLRLRASGSFGAVNSAPRAVYCTRTAEGEPVGGVYEADSAYTRLRRLAMVRLDGTRPRYTGPVDSLRVLQIGKLQRDVTRSITPAYSKLGRLFTAAPVVLPDGTVELWVVPWPSKARTLIMGGDVAYIRNAAGAVQRIVDHTASWTTVPLPGNGLLRLNSNTADAAVVGDLATARYYTDLGREVTVTTATAVSALVPGLDPATGARMVWKHTPAK